MEQILTDTDPFRLSGDIDVDVMQCTKGQPISSESHQLRVTLRLQAGRWVSALKFCRWTIHEVAMFTGERASPSVLFSTCQEVECSKKLVREAERKHDFRKVGNNFELENKRISKEWTCGSRLNINIFNIKWQIIYTIKNWFLRALLNQYWTRYLKERIHLKKWLSYEPNDAFALLPSDLVLILTPGLCPEFISMFITWLHW